MKKELKDYDIYAAKVVTPRPCQMGKLKALYEHGDKLNDAA